jgi:hypothetical protein
MAPQMSVLGIDIAKLVFHVIGMDDIGYVVLRKRLARSESLPFIAPLSPLRNRHFQYLLRCIVPRSVLEAKVMQPTTRFHHGIPNAILQEADLIFHHSVAFHPTKDVCDADSDGENTTIGDFLRRGEFPATRFLFEVNNRDVGQDESLEAHILIEITSGRQARALQLSQDLIVGLPFTGSTQEAHLTGCINHQEVVDRMTCLFAAVVCLLVFWIGWALASSSPGISPLCTPWPRTR